VITMPDVNSLFPRLDENAQQTAQELIDKAPSPSRQVAWLHLGRDRWRR
jgi:hypothetical protein